MRLLVTISTAICVTSLLSFTTAAAKTRSNKQSNAAINYRVEVHPQHNTDRDLRARRTSAFAASETTFLAYYTFDNGPAACDEEGWTSHDVTVPVGDPFHVDDFSACGPGTFGRLYALEGDKSLWCGACPDPENEAICRYAVLPGYGDRWDQAFCTKNCVFVDSLATLDYLVMWDSEPEWDFTTVEYTLCSDPDDDWIAFAGGAGVYDGVGGPTFVSDTIPVAMDSIRIRFHFTSDGGWSDEDGRYDTDGAIIIDSVTVRCAGAGIVVPTELFEDESVGDREATDWERYTYPSYGDFAQLIPAFQTTYQNDPVQEDPCATNFTCMWNFYKGSVAYYGHNWPDPSPQQQVVPYRNERDQYIHNEICSPWIPLAGAGTIVNLEFDVYRDLNTDGWVFYYWNIRSMVDGCAILRDYWPPSIYYGTAKDWFRAVHSVGDLIEPGASHIQIALGVWDLCPLVTCYFWGVVIVHSHSPLFDNVEVYRIQTSGPQFGVRDIDMFQDNFSADGTITGSARADMAQDILPLESSGILPGDSACITVNDPEVGLGGDTFTGCGPAAYCYISVDPQGQPGKTALNIQASDTRGTCGLRWPYINSTAAADRTWYVYRMDSCFAANGDLAANRYCIDFNDNLFTPGDTCWFFFGAQNSAGAWNFFSLPYGRSSSINLVAGDADEFTILPAVGDEPGYDILYVDGMNFRGAQPYFDSSFQANGIFERVDRYDIRGPSSEVSNRPASRVVSLAQILPPVYRKIIYNSGDLRDPAIGDGGVWDDDKSDDCGLLALWLSNAQESVGLWLNGDDLPEDMLSPGGAGLRAYISYNVVNEDHVAYGVGVNPALAASPTSLCFDSNYVTVAFGGCPLINRFDVITANPPTSRQELEYWRDWLPPGEPTGGATVAQTTLNAESVLVHVALEGFSFHYIRNREDHAYLGGLARHHHMNRIMECLEEPLADPIAVRPNVRKNSLAQNYPNPFNPITAIKYTIKEKAHVTLRIYNVAGQLVRTLVDEVQRPDEVTPVRWNGVNNAGHSVSSGVYFYRLVTKNFTETKKMVVLK